MSRRATLISAPSQCGSSCGSRCEGSVSPPTPPGPWPTSLRSSLGQLFPASRGRTGSVAPGLEVAGAGHRRPGKLAARPGPGRDAGWAERGAAPRCGAAELLQTGQGASMDPAPQRRAGWGASGTAGSSCSGYFLQAFIYTVPSVYITAGLQHFFPLSGIFR